MPELRNYLLAEGERLALAEGPGKTPDFNPEKYSLAPGLTIKPPFRTLGSGHVTSRYDGEPVVQYLSAFILEEMARVFQERLREDPVVIDWNHGSSPNPWATASTPAASGSLGAIVDAFVFDDGARGPGLYVVPAYSEDGLKVVKANEGTLYSSPEFVVGPVYAREARGKKLGDAQLLAVALTNRPAQTATAIDPVKLTEGGQDPAQEEDPMKTLNAALLAAMSFAEASPITEEDRQHARALAEKLGALPPPLTPAAAPDGTQSGPIELSEAEREILKGAGIEATTLKGGLLKLAEAYRAQAAAQVAAQASLAETQAKAAVNGMVAIGRIPPFQRQAAEKLYKQDQALFSELYGAVPPHAALDLRPAVGHEAPTGDGPDVVAEVAKFAEANGLEFGDAMHQLAAQRPELFVER
jgi:hypothetical protein